MTLRSSPPHNGRTVRLSTSTFGTTLIALGVLVAVVLVISISSQPRRKKAKSPAMVDKKTEDSIVQFCGVTGASTKDARKYLDKYKRVDIAIDAYYNDPTEFAASSRHQINSSAPSTSRINSLFSKYRDPDAEEISVDGTLRLCQDLEVNPEDVVLLAVAYELKSPRVGEWNKAGWTEGWKSLGCDTIPAMKATLPRLRDKLSSDPTYFRKVYNHTFDFARSEGQRSLGIETAQAFWGLLLPHGLEGGALAHTAGGDDEDVNMDAGEDGWKDEYTQWWFDFLNEKGGKGVSKDTWTMFLDFTRSINSDFTNYDMEEAWPSTIDDFVEYAKGRLAGGI